MISGTWNPGFQDSRSALELASFDWFQHVGYESHSVYVKKLDFQHRISKFHHSWKLPEIFWNSGYCLEMANFLPISTYRVPFPLIFFLKQDFQCGIPKFHQFDIRKLFRGTKMFLRLNSYCTSKLLNTSQF